MEDSRNDAENNYVIIQNDPIVTKIRKACTDMNSYFHLLVESKEFNFPTDRHESYIDGKDDPTSGLVDSLELMKLYLWILGGIGHLMYDSVGCSKIYNLLNALDIQEESPHWSYNDEEHELDEIQWPARFCSLLINFCKIFKDLRPWKGDSKKFYETRANLFEVFRTLLYANENFINEGSEVSKNHLNDLQKGCLPFLVDILINLAHDEYFDMAIEIKDEHQRWLERVAHFYFIEYDILNQGFDELSKKDQDTAKACSIVLHEGADVKKLAYHVGFIVDCINSAFDSILEIAIPRCVLGREHGHLEGLCTFLMKKMSELSVIKINEYCFTDTTYIHDPILKCRNVIPIISTRGSEEFSVSGYTREVASILSSVVRILITSQGRFVAKKGADENTINKLLSIVHNEDREPLDYLLNYLESLMNDLLSSKKSTSPSKEGSLANTVKRLRQTCFPWVASFGKNLGEIFILSEDQAKKHQVWVNKKLKILLERALEFKTAEKAKTLYNLTRGIVSPDSSLPEKNIKSGSGKEEEEEE